SDKKKNYSKVTKLLVKPNIIKYYFSSTKDIKPLVIFYCCISVIVYIIPALFPQLESYLIDSITQI
ncbi:hypothetical protein, partial [Holdemanella biformis]|uniref:hypothetical protein n=1 Tax=Holdemanella biformis TaxID=1735 RepID=UPI00266BD7EF